MAVCLLGLFSSCGFAFPRLDVVVLLSLIIFLCCCVWLVSLRSLFFSKERHKGSDSGWEGRWGGTGRSRGRETVIRMWENNLFSIKKKSFSLQWVMVNADSELVKVSRINDYGCSGPNETSMSTCPRLRRHPDRPWKEQKSWNRKECREKRSFYIRHSCCTHDLMNQLLAAKDLPKICLKHSILKWEIEY